MNNAGLPPHMQSEFIPQRQAYQQKMEAQLARWRADIVTMEAQMDQAPMGARIAFQERLTALKSKLRHGEERLEKMKETTGDAWGELQSDIDDLWQDISQSVDQAKTEFQ